MGRPEAKVQRLSQSLLTLYFAVGSLTEPGPPLLNWLGWLASEIQGPFPVSPSQALRIQARLAFTRVLGIKLRSSQLLGEHYPASHLPSHFHILHKSENLSHPEWTQGSL